MAISKSTPYVRYKENFTSNLHLGTIHVESEYLDRTQKTTIESIHGMTWHNKVVNENKELDLLSNLGFELTESKKEYFNVGEQRVPVDEIHGMQDIEPNEDGTYTYSVTSIEGEYAEIYDGLNNITSTSDGLDGNFEIVYDTDEEDITGSVVLDATMPNYTIEDSNIGELNDVVFKGETLVNILPQPSLRNEMENISTQRLNEGHDEVVVTDGEYKSAILKGQTLKNITDYNISVSSNVTIEADGMITINANGQYTEVFLPALEKLPSTKYLVGINVIENTLNGDFVFHATTGVNCIFAYSATITQGFVGVKEQVRITMEDVSSAVYAFRSYLGSNVTEGVIKYKVMAIPYQEGMENWGIPYFTGMQSVKMPVLTTTGKNLFDSSKIIYNKVVNGSNPTSLIDSTNRNTLDYTSVIPNERIIVSGFTVSAVYAYDENKNYIERVSGVSSTGGLLSTNTHFVRIAFDNTIDFSKAQIEYGTQKTEYEPHKSNILTVNEEVELRGIGDVKDELNLLTGELTQRVEKFDSRMGWEYVNYQDDNFISLFKRNELNIKKSDILCDKLVVENWSDLQTSKKECVWFNGTSSWGVILSKTKATNKEEIIEWLSQNLEINYKLATPTIKTVVLTVTDQDNVVLETGKPRSYKDGHIQVQSNGILPSSISYEVPSQNHIHVDMLKPSNTYTLKRNGENFEGSFFIDGTEYNTNVFMTSHQLPNKSLIINDMSEHDKVAMFEGNYGTSNIPYFEGMTSVKMPVLTTNSSNLIPPFTEWEILSGEPSDYSISEKRVEIKLSRWNMGVSIKKQLKPNTMYTVGWDEISFNTFNFTGTTTVGDKTPFKTFTTDDSGMVTFKLKNSTTSGTFIIDGFRINEGNIDFGYTPFKSNILTCNEEVTLRGIGDVKDELNSLTGELTQRIGEVVFDGSENWQRSTVNGKNAFTVPHGGKAKGGVISLSGEVICDKDNAAPYETFFYIGGSYFNYLTTKDFTRTEFKQYLQSNPITIQYQLTEPTTKKVTSAILDQDGRQIHSMHTYTGLTNLSTSSDTLIPNVSLDYEISSSTGTVTGTSATIENGENGSPISAIVYGESLVNSIQEPSDIECVVLGEHIGSDITIENSVEGNIKNAILKGQTLVNIAQQYSKFGTHTGDVNFDGEFFSYTKPTTVTSGLTFRSIYGNFEIGKQISIYVNNQSDVSLYLYDSSYEIKGTFKKGVSSVLFTTDSDSIRIGLLDNSIEANIKVSVMIFEGDCTNCEIPYFTGMQSVKMPVLKSMGKNLFSKKNLTVDGYIVADGRVIIQLNDNRNATDYIEVLPDTMYTMSGVKNSGVGGGNTTQYVAFYDKNKEYLTYAHVNVTSDKFSITTSSETIYIRMSVRNADIDRLQIEKGTTTTTYEPHKSNILSCNEEVILRSNGANIYDELNLFTGELIQRIGTYTFTGDESWFVSGPADGAKYFTLRQHYINPQVLGGASAVNLPIICNRLPTIKYLEFTMDNSGINFTYDLRMNFTNCNCNQGATAEDLKAYLKANPTTIYYPITEVVKTVDLTVTDQDGNPTSLHSYNDTTHIATNSQGLTANVEISNPSYDVVLKADTEYTLKLNRTNAPTDTPLEINLGGTEATMDSTVNSITITTPSTLVNNKLTLGGVGNKFKEAMVIEGDCVDRNLNYFEGIVGVENPILMTTGKNLFDGELKVGGLVSNGTIDYSLSNRIVSYNLIPIKNNIQYKLSSADNLLISRICFYDNNKQFLSQSYTNDFISPTNAKYLRFAFMNTKNIESQIMLEEGSTASTYEPYKSNTLTTYPQVTLRSIGNIKDELDLVNGTVTRRIGEVVLNGSEDWAQSAHGNSTMFYTSFNNLVRKEYYLNSISCDKFVVHANESYLFNSTSPNGISAYTDWADTYLNENWIYIKHADSEGSVEKFKQWLAKNSVTVQYELAEPTTESVYITPPTPRTSTASVTLPIQLGESDYVTWNPYKEHYVHYNYEQDGSYTWENLTDLNERQFIELYDRRTYVEQEYKNTFLSHDSKGTSKYVLIEPNQDYTVTVRFSELPQCETVKVNLGGSEVEMNVSDPHVHVTTPNTLSNYLCSISSEGLSGKITDILVIHCLEHEGFADIDYFEGIDSIGEVVDGKASIIVQQTNGNLLDFEPVVYNNGNYISMSWSENNRGIPLKANKNYVVKFPRPKYTLSSTSWGDYGVRTFDKNLTNIRTIARDSDVLRRHPFTAQSNEKYLRFYGAYSENGSTNAHVPIELCYAEMEKDETTIRPRYYDKQEIILPMQLCRINTVYDNFYYDVIRGHYRIQQSIGHKYFTGADNENWTMIGKEERILRFRYNNADIQIKSLGEYMTNRFTNGTATSPYESCAFSGSTFIISIDKERLSNATLTAFKEWLSSHNVHLYYQLATPMMIDLPQYSSKLELNTYKDEIYTFLKNCKPTVFTLDVPLDQTYRFYELQESQGYTNRIELTDERMTEEDALYINTIYGSGISNLIEEPNNVNTLLKPNYEGRATSHTLTNGKVSTISVHGFEPNGVKVGVYNTVTKQYELTVKATSGANNNSVAFPIPYALEQYEDGTHDRVYYNSEYKQWMFEGKQTLTVAYNSSTGVFTNAIEVFRGMMPRSGMIGEFKVKFASGTTSARLYYSLDGSTYTYTTLRSMTDGDEYYIAFFNTGGTKIDMGTKTGANSEYTTLVPLSGTVSEALMINQIQSITECTYYLDKTYYYTEPTRPIELTVYEGTNTITENNGAIITIENNAHNKDALIYANTPYTVYWTYVGGEGNIKVTLGGTTQEVAATQGYVTITTSDADLERGLLIGGFDVTIKDLMLVKGERIADLSYFEGSRAVGTAFIDEDGNTMYRITLVTGSELIQDKFEDVITFEDNKKHNVLVTKLLGTKPNKN